MCCSCTRGLPWGIRFQRAACTLGGTSKGCPQGLRTRCASGKRTQPSHHGKTHSLLSIISTLTREFPRFHVSAVARPLCTRPDAKVRTGSCCSAPWGSSVSGILPLAAPTCPACDPFVNESTNRSSSPARAPVGKRSRKAWRVGKPAPRCATLVGGPCTDTAAFYPMAQDGITRERTSGMRARIVTMQPRYFPRCPIPRFRP